MRPYSSAPEGISGGWPGSTSGGVSGGCVSDRFWPGCIRRRLAFITHIQFHGNSVVILGVRRFPHFRLFVRGSPEFTNFARIRLLLLAAPPSDTIAYARSRMGRETGRSRFLLDEEGSR